MAKIIMFGNQKGGIGKSTLSILAANALAGSEFEYKVLIIDNDTQRSVTSIRQYDTEIVAEEYEDDFEFPYDVKALTYAQIRDKIVDFDRDYDFVFIDTPGRIDLEEDIKQQEITKLLSFVDFVFVPFKGGALNLDSTLRYSKLLLDIQELRKDKPRPLSLYGLVNFYRENAITDQELKEEIDYLQSNTNIVFMNAKMRQYALYERLNTYKSIYIEGRTSNKARKSFSTWFDEFLRIILK
ncbi:MAG: ParA family protein [Saprospiraceae bacterium]|nr:ParA family protein [Saprospiraceae bacterium]